MPVQKKVNFWFQMDKKIIFLAAASMKCFFVRENDQNEYQLEIF